LSITAYVITLDEEHDLADCLESVSWCDELLVVDSFSTDGTVELARSLGARVVQNPWLGFARQKQFALSQVRTEWGLNLDADERVSASLGESIRAAIAAADRDVAAFSFPRTTYHLGRFFRHGTLYETVRRLARTDRSRWVGVDVHERLDVDGRVEHLAGDLIHCRNRDLSGQLETYDRYSTLKAQELFGRGVRAGAFSVVSRPLARFVRSYLFKQGFRMGTAGLVEALEQATYDFYKYAKIWEKGITAGGARPRPGEPETPVDEPARFPAGGAATKRGKEGTR